MSNGQDIGYLLLAQEEESREENKPKEIPVEEIASSAEITAKSVALGAEKVGKAIYDTLYAIDPRPKEEKVPSSQIFRDFEEVEKELDVQSYGQKRTDIQELSEEVPALYGGLKIGSVVGKGVPKIIGTTTPAKIARYSIEGAVDNFTFDYLTGRLAKEDSESFADLDPEKVKTSVTVGAVAGGTIAGTAIAAKKTGQGIAGVVKDAKNTYTAKKAENSSPFEEELNKSGESFFDKIDPTARKQKDISMSARVGRVAVRLLVRHTGREIQHLYHTTKDVGKEIYAEAADLMATKYNNIKNINIEEVGKEAAESFFKKNKEKVNPKTFEADKVKVEKEIFEENIDSVNKVFDSSDYLKKMSRTEREKISSRTTISEVKNALLKKVDNENPTDVFTDNWFSIYSEVAGSKATKIISDLDKKFIDNKRIDPNEIKRAISEIMDEAKNKFTYRSKTQDTFNVTKTETGKVKFDETDKITTPPKKVEVKKVSEKPIIYDEKINTTKVGDNFSVEGKLHEVEPKGLTLEQARLQKISGAKVLKSEHSEVAHISNGKRTESDGVFSEGNVIIGSKAKEDVVSHELVHSVMTSKIRTNPSLAKELNDIRNDLIEAVKGKEFTQSEAYGLSDKHIAKKTDGDLFVDEFVAEAFSNPNFMKTLNNIDASKRSSLITRIADFIRNVFKKDSAVFEDLVTSKVKVRKGSLLDEAIKSTRRNFEEPVVKREKLITDETIGQVIDRGTAKVSKTLKDNNVFELKPDGSINLAGFETKALSEIFNDLGLTNKETMSKIIDIRNKTQGLVSQAKEVSKAIAKTIKESGIDNASVLSIVRGRVATALSKNSLDDILAVNTKDLAAKYGVGESLFKNIKKTLGEGSNVKTFKNIEQLYRQAGLRKGSKFDDFKLDMERLIAKQYIEADGLTKYLKDPKYSEAINTIRSIEDIETATLKENIQFGYSGFYSPYKYEIKVATGKLEIDKLKESGQGWKQVDGSNTFYRLDLSPNVSDGIVPIQSKPFQGTIITKNVTNEAKRLKDEGIPFSFEIKNGKKIIRLYPDNRLAKHLDYETDPSKMLAGKYVALAKSAIRNQVLKTISKDVKDMFSLSPKDGFKQIDPDIAPNFISLFRGADKKAPIYVKKEFADILSGAAETLIFKGSSRDLQMAEQVYKDMIKRFKRSVTVKSVSSIVNNYLVVPSILKLNGIPAKEIPAAMRQAHLDYADFINGMDVYQKMLANFGRDKAQKYLDNFVATNNVAKLSKDGGIQSALDDFLIQIANETDHISYGIKSGAEKLAGKSTADTIMNIVDFVNLSPNTTIGSFLMNKFVMADVIGRISLYNSLIKKVPHSEALKKTNDSFVNFSVPYPKAIRIAEEYGVPFIGWAYRMQLPILRMAKENPLSTASVVGLYMALDGMGGGDGYAGDLKIDSWFIHNSLGDSSVVMSSGIAKMNPILDIRPQLLKEVSGVASGDKNPLELTGLNVR